MRKSWDFIPEDINIYFKCFLKETKPSWLKMGAPFGWFQHNKQMLVYQGVGLVLLPLELDDR